MPAVLRHDWTRAEVLALFELSFPELMARAGAVHREHFDPRQVQVSTLLSIKTGGCPEDCAYCPQAARYNTGLKAHKLLTVEEVVERRRRPRPRGPRAFAWAPPGVRPRTRIWRKSRRWSRR
jgi:biotin synthase